MFMMTPCMISGLSIPTKNLRFSLPVCLFSINILVYRLGFKSVTRLWDYYESEILARVQTLIFQLKYQDVWRKWESSTILVLGIVLVKFSNLYLELYVYLANTWIWKFAFNGDVRILKGHILYILISKPFSILMTTSRYNPMTRACRLCLESVTFMVLEQFILYRAMDGLTMFLKLTLRV